jgi:hypothetical protein
MPAAKKPIRLLLEIVRCEKPSIFKKSYQCHHHIVKLRYLNMSVLGANVAIQDLTPRFQDLATITPVVAPTPDSYPIWPYAMAAS